MEVPRAGRTCMPSGGWRRGRR